MIERFVKCYCGKKEVVTRRPTDKDKYVVCSFDCWLSMVYDGNHEPGTLFREVNHHV